MLQYIDTVLFFMSLTWLVLMTILGHATPKVEASINSFLFFLSSIIAHVIFG